jgi:membrane-associated protease RseP (regulator of RpoE activity)
VIIFLHESGHYLAARATGMKATEFFLGFGPRIWSFRRGETRFGIKAIWAGAYVKVDGMNALEEVDPADESRTYRSATYPRKLLLASAGSLMHFALAGLLLFVLFAVTGAPREDNWRVAEVVPGSGAAAAGLEEGDSIVAIDGRSTDEFSSLVDTVRPRPGQDVVATVERDGEQSDITISVGSTERGGETIGLIGVRAEYPPVREGVLEAAGSAVTELPNQMKLAVQGVWGFVSNFGDFIERVFTPPGEDEPTENLESRPLSLVGVVQIGAESGTATGWSSVVYLLAVLNIFLGVFNLLPVLPLDGGHIAIATYERIRSRPGRRYVADITKIMPVAYAVFMLLVFLGIGSLWLDITNSVTR